MAHFKIPLNSVPDLLKAVRDMPTQRPTKILLTSKAGFIEGIYETLATLRLPQYVTELTVNITNPFPSKKLVEAGIKLIVTGPSFLVIFTWPDDQASALLEALVDKKGLSTLVAYASNTPYPLTKLGKSLQSLTVRFPRFFDTDWTEFGSTVATSSTLSELVLTGFVPETAFPPHLPINLRVFKVDSEWAISFYWLSHGYWPLKLERLELKKKCKFPKLPELTEIMKVRFRDVESLSLDVGAEQLSALCDILSAENRIDDLSVWNFGELDPLLQMLTKPFAFMSDVFVSQENLETKGALKLWRVLRGKTRARIWEFQTADGLCWKNDDFKWFLVKQTLLSVHELPKLKVGCVAGLVPWRDHIFRIAETLDWPLDKYGDEDDEDMSEDQN